MATKKLISLFAFLILHFTFLVLPPAVSADWPMVGANPARTSWTSDQVNPVSVNWYRVIEPYISPHVQPILARTAQYANGLVYISTSKGLYVYRADTGAFVWSYLTEMPLGNSPSVDSNTNVVYVGGFDRKIHALNASTGVQVWEYSGAQAGFDTNPLLVDGKVIVGNRDGKIYAVNSATGSLSWAQNTDGPVRFSSAYKNGVVYTVSNDGFVYANNSNTGALLWKSQTQYSDGKMRGDGFNSYWPVVYTDTGGTNKDYIIVAGSEGYRAFDRPGTQSLNVQTNCGSYEWCEWFDQWNGNPSGTLGQIVASEAWALGRQEVDFINTLSEYFANDPTAHAHYHKPWRRFIYIFDAQTGQEWTMNSKNNRPTYMPVDPILSNSGNIYPPVIGSDNLIYIGNHWDASSQSRIMGWKFGTSRMVIQGLQQAGDEPPGVSAGGNLIYRVICCDRAGETSAISGSGGGSFWTYNLSDLAPGYDNMWWGSDMDNMSRLYGSYGRLSTLLGAGVSVNGMYHQHGDQSPIVPFNGRAYTIKSNALIVFGSGSRTQLPKQTYTAAVSSGPDFGIDQNNLISRLETEVSKIITAGHLRPGLFNAGMFANSFPWLNDYFSVPGDTILALSRAYPHLNTNLKSQVKSYLATEYANFNQINWQGAAREWMALPPEVETDLTSAPTEGQVDKYYVYALWKYAQNVAPENKSAIVATANSIRNSASSLGAIDLDQAASNRNAAGDIGWAGLNNQSTSLSVCNWFVRNSPWGAVNGIDNKRAVNNSRNFLFLVPEVGDCLSRNSTVINAFPEYEWMGPYWFVSRYTASVNESTNQNLYDYPSMFSAKAYVQKLPKQELVKYLDVPAFKVGDLFYIQNLVAAIEAPSVGGGPTVTPLPSSTPAPTLVPSPTPGAPGNPVEWNLTFSDEFSGTVLDRNKWATKYAYDSGHGDRSNNDEKQWYVDDAHTLTGGFLNITAKKECRTVGSDIYFPYKNTNGTVNCSANISSTYPYTSGIISSHNRFSQLYGYFEARIKNPAGQGLWPAFWLLPDPAIPPAIPPEPTPWPDPNVLWPPEIDIMENRGDEVTNIRLNNIYGGLYPQPGNQSNNWSSGYDLGDTSGESVNFTTDFHTFGLKWEPGLLVWYIDGIEKRRVTTNVPPGSALPGKMYLLLNLAVGGSFPGNPDASTVFPSSLQVDYVRVYEKKTAKSGDANSDGRVDGVDYVTWLNHYGQNVTGSSVGDFNNSGAVDGVDYVIWLTNYGT
jgi:beta-glucanase (GH16 family)/outer membrane protein assembly factor BamB